MTRGQSDDATATATTTTDWPTFGVTYTYNPTTELAVSLDLRPDELVAYEADAAPADGCWITADRESHVRIEDVR